MGNRKRKAQDTEAREQNLEKLTSYKILQKIAQIDKEH